MKGFLVNKPTVLITGGAGYIGSHVGLLCARANYHVVILDSFVHGQHFNPTWATVIHGEYANSEILKNIFSTYSITAVVHCAASIEVGISVRDPISFYENNVAKTITLVDQMLRANVKNIIFSSSCAVYGQPQFLPLTETHQIKPMSPYGRTKAMVEEILKDASDAYGLRYIALRYFNAAGALPEEGLGEQHKPETHLIPLLLKAALLREPFTIFGSSYPTRDGSAVRDFVHVLDIANAHLLALEHLSRGNPSDAFNLGTGFGYSIKEMIDGVQRISGIAVRAITAPPRAGDPHTLVADPIKAKTLLQWQPRYSDLDFILKSALVFFKQQDAIAQPGILIEKVL
ncbi:UDP-glucose 4-epimerase GalE [Candidatus Dependentiae bacterium]|nr:UDP-glucose 4-epimerase GalE [Candidatus Dependentiae bacterium]